MGQVGTAPEVPLMTVILTLILVGFMLATLYALVRGIIAFLQTTEADLKNPNAGPSQSAIKQNKAMMMRIIFQGVAVFIVVLMLSMRHSS